MSSITSFVRPAYENLLCSYAMVTLSEFATYLRDANATLELMETTSIHIQLGGKAEPVGRWALNVLRKFVYDREGEGENHDIAAWQAAEAGISGHFAQPKGSVAGDTVSTSLDGVMWGSDALAEQDFPSLEHMFLIN